MFKFKIVFWLFIFPSFVFAAPLQKELDQIVKKAIADERIVGAVVLVSKNGNVVYQRAAGFSDREAQIPVTVDTVFRLASLTKPMLTVAALKLMDQGKMQLDDPVTRYLPEFKPKTVENLTPTILMRQLLTHTAGLTYGFSQPPDGEYHRLGISDGLDSVNFSMAENLKRLSSAHLLNQPGSAWTYSLATDVLGEILSKVENKPLPMVVDQQVVLPLHLKSTAFYLKPSRLVAVPYANHDPKPIRIKNNQQVAFDQSYITFSPKRLFDKNAYPSGGAGMVATAGDYLNFLEGIRKGTIGLKDHSLKMLTTNQVGNLKTALPGWGWSLGFLVLTDPKLANTPQASGTYGWGGVYGNTAWVDPINEITTVVLTNTAFEGMSGQFPNDIMQAIYQQKW